MAAAVAHLAQRRKDELLAAADDLPAGPERTGEPEDALRDQAVPAGLALEFVAEVRLAIEIIALDCRARCPTTLTTNLNR